MKSDPKVRLDGCCARPGCKKPRQAERSRKYAGDQAEHDPFCSVGCCRAYHGCELARAGEEAAA